MNCFIVFQVVLFIFTFYETLQSFSFYLLDLYHNRYIFIGCSDMIELVELWSLGYLTLSYKGLRGLSLHYDRKFSNPFLEKVIHHGPVPWLTYVFVFNLPSE